MEEKRKEKKKKKKEKKRGVKGFDKIFFFLQRDKKDLYISPPPRGDRRRYVRIVHNYGDVCLVTEHFETSCACRGTAEFSRVIKTHAQVIW